MAEGLAQPMSHSEGGMSEENSMVLSTLVKLKTLGLAKQVILGAFINGALIGATVVAGAAMANRGRAAKAEVSTGAVRPKDTDSP